MEVFLTKVLFVFFLFLSYMSFVQELRVIRWTELGEILQVKKARNKRKDNFTNDEIWFIHFLQLLEMVYGEAGVEAPKLNLTFLCDNRFLHFILHSRVKTLPGWQSTSWKCRSVSAQESRSWTSPCSTSPSTTRMRQQLLSWASPAPCTLSLRWKFRGFNEDLPTFTCQELRDLEVQYLDDSKTFRTSIQSMSSNLTRICLNKMMSISFETLSAIKMNCG